VFKQDMALGLSLQPFRTLPVLLPFDWSFPQKTGLQLIGILCTNRQTCAEYQTTESNACSVAHTFLPWDGEPRPSPPKRQLKSDLQRNGAICHSLLVIGRL